MPRCTSCGHDSPDHYRFCLNCGTKLEPSTDHTAISQTPHPAPVLPETTAGSIVCQHCGTPNASQMHYCSHCGRAIGPATIAASGNGAGTPLAQAPTPVASSGSAGPVRAPRPTPPAGVRPPAAFDGSLTIPSPSEVVRGGPPPAVEDEQMCPHCAGRTPAGFRFCQRCGKPLEDHGGASIPTSAGAHGQVAEAAHQIRHQAREPAAPRPSPPSDSGAAIRSQRWGTMVCLNRDGTQGAEYPLSGDYVDIGSDAQITFSDPFLAPRHLRLEPPGKSAAYLTPLDRTNGVFVRVTEQVPLASAAVVLLGRELLRFDLLDASEREVIAATQHGVKIFGSPVRDAWGRLSQLLPNGCVRDVRHLVGVEVIVGREEGDVVFADDEFLSRRHASFKWRDSRCYFEDLGSSNGSFVRLTERTELSTGTQLRFGDQVVRIDL